MRLQVPNPWPETFGPQAFGPQTLGPQDLVAPASKWTFRSQIRGATRLSPNPSGPKSIGAQIHRVPNPWGPNPSGPKCVGSQIHGVQIHRVQIHRVQICKVQIHRVQIHGVPNHRVRNHRVQSHILRSHGSGQVTLLGSPVPSRGWKTLASFFRVFCRKGVIFFN